MAGSRASVWVSGGWAWCCSRFRLVLADFVAPRRADPWFAAQTGVWSFVLGVVAMALGPWTFALRESLALRDVRAGKLDSTTPAGRTMIRRTLVALWSLCLVIGMLGCVIAWGAGSAELAWSYLLAGGLLMLLHAPRRWISGSPPAAGA